MNGSPQSRQTIHTVAGNDWVGDGTPAALAPLRQPEGLAADARGRLFIADAGDNRIRVVGADGVVQTYAGDGHPGFTGDGAQATKAQFRSPYGVAVDLGGNVYVADFGNARVRKITPAGIVSTVAGGGSKEITETGNATEVRLAAPRNVAVDNAGTLYVSDFAGHRILRVTPWGAISVLAGSGQPGLAGDGGPAALAMIHAPAGLAVDRAGTVYFADTGNKRIRYVNTAGRIETLGVAGMPAFVFPIPLYAPVGVALDANGVLYISDGDQALRMPPLGQPTAIPGGAHDMAIDAAGAIHAIRGKSVWRVGLGSDRVVAGGGTYGYSGDGKPATETRFQQPNGIAVDGAGAIVVADTGNARLRRIAPAGTVASLLANLNGLAAVAANAAGDIFYLDTAGGSVWKLTAGGALGLHTSGLTRPAGIALDSAGVIYVAETGAHRIRRIAAPGDARVIAGTGAAGGEGDGGTAVFARFNAPRGIAVDAKGALYIADAGNNRVRRIDTNGVVETVMDGMNGPCAVALDAAGTLYVADTGYHRVRKLLPSGEAVTVAGTAEEGFNGESGDAAAIQLSYPNALAFDAAGNLLIADTGNNRIRMLALATIAPVNTRPANTTTALRVRHAATLQDGPFAAGQSVLIEGLAAETPIWFDEFPGVIARANDGTVLAQIPAGAAWRDTITLRAGEVTRTLSLAAAAPGIFPSGAVASSGGVLSLSATGEGVFRLPVAFNVGGAAADVLAVAPSPSAPGANDYAIRIPAAVGPGLVSVEMRVGSISSPTVQIRIE